MERIRMNTKRSVTWGLLAGAAACAVVAAMPGCELLVDFDRSKIPTADASFGDDVAELPDAPTSPDAAPEGSTPGTDAAADATSPALDAGDSGSAAPDTGTPDAGSIADTGVVDTGVADTGVVDTGTAAEAGADASNGVDAGGDSGADTTADAADGS
jgi:hypothetical protein